MENKSSCGVIGFISIVLNTWKKLLLKINTIWWSGESQSTLLDDSSKLTQCLSEGQTFIKAIHYDHAWHSQDACLKDY